MPGLERLRVGWDIGGAHVKACLMHDGELLDVAQWPCPLWQGLAHLDTVLVQATRRWPALPRPRVLLSTTMAVSDVCFR